MLIVAGVECSSSRYFADWLCGCSLDRGVQDSKQLAECVMFLESQLSPEVQAKGWQAQLFTQAKDAWIDPSKVRWIGPSNIECMQYHNIIHCHTDAAVTVFCGPLREKSGRVGRVICLL